MSAKKAAAATAVAGLAGGIWIGTRTADWLRRATAWLRENGDRSYRDTASAVLDAMEDRWGPASPFTPPWTKPKAPPGADGQAA
jgi:hypothetical protein